MWYQREVFSSHRRARVQITRRQLNTETPFKISASFLSKRHHEELFYRLSIDPCVDHWCTIFLFGSVEIKSLSRNINADVQIADIANFLTIWHIYILQKTTHC